MLTARLLLKVYEWVQLAWSRMRPRNRRVGPDPVVDPMQPVSNEELVQALGAYVRGWTMESDWELRLALAKAVFLVPGDRHSASVRRADGRAVLAPGSGVPPRRPSLPGLDPGVLVAFTDEQAMDDMVGPDCPLQLLYATEAIECALSRGVGMLVYSKAQESLELTVAHCRDVRRLLGRATRARHG